MGLSPIFLRSGLSRALVHSTRARCCKRHPSLQRLLGGRPPSLQRFLPYLSRPHSCSSLSASPASPISVAHLLRECAHTYNILHLPCERGITISFCICHRPLFCSRLSHRGASLSLNVKEKMRSREQVQALHSANSPPAPAICVLLLLRPSLLSSRWTQRRRFCDPT